MSTMPRRKHEPTTKVKRLSLDSQYQEPAPKTKPQKRWVPTREKPQMKAPEKIPNFRDIRPQYNAPSQQAPQEAPVQQPQVVQPQQPVQQPPAPQIGFGFVLFLIFVFVITLVFGYVITDNIDGGGGSGGGSGCPTSCGGQQFLILRPGCDCPSGSTYYSTITNKQCIGCKQCICR